MARHRKVDVKAGAMPAPIVIEHAVVADRVARLRDATLPAATFRRLVEELGTFLAYEATRDLPLAAAEVRTPIAIARGRRLTREVVVAPILRAGLGLLPGFLRVIDDASVAHLGFYRHPETLAAVPYYANLPAALGGCAVFVLDPMLATGHSATAALDVLAARGATGVTVLCAIAAAPGLAHLAERHPSARVVAAACDDGLDEHGYIVPGLGDAGDRLFGSATSLPVGFPAS